MNENFNTLAGSIIDIHVDNHEDMAKSAKLWNIDEYQIDAGPFKGSIKAILTPFTQLGEVSRSSGVVVKGSGPKDCYVFVYIYGQGKGTVTSNGVPTKINELIVFEYPDHMDTVSTNGHNSVTIVVQKKFFDNEYKKCFGDSFTYDKLIKRIKLKNKMQKHLKDTFIRLISLGMENQVKLKEDTEFLQSIEKRIMQTLFQCIDPVGNVRSLHDSERYANMIRVYLNLHFTEELTLQQTSKDLHISDRSVRRGFNQLFGMNPKKYLLHYRLGRVHKALLEGTIENNSVQEIAYEHGFYHLGRFPGIYRKMFGENPLDTLKRSS